MAQKSQTQRPAAKRWVAQMVGGNHHVIIRHHSRQFLIQHSVKAGVDETHRQPTGPHQNFAAHRRRGGR